MIVKKIRNIWCFICILILAGITFYINDTDSESIVVNEVCNNNFSNYSDNEGNYFSWVEIYNRSDSPKSIKGYKITNKDREQEYEFGDTEIGAHEYITVFFGEEEKKKIENELYADFPLAFDEEVIYLCNADNKLIDAVEVPRLEVNWSFARKDDGEEEWRAQVATPAASNNNQQEYKERTEDERILQPQFSVSSGFYEDPFYLTISAEDGMKIYYTLDGNEPNENSFLYTEKIKIEDASLKPNVYSMREDTTAQFYTDEIPSLPGENIDKANVVRAVCIDQYGNQSEISTATYFVGFHEKDAYEDLFVASLVSDSESWFGYDSGIYVTGKTYDGVQVTDDWLWQKANYRNKGRSAERGLHVEVFDENHELVIEKEAGVRIRGKATRAYPQKSFNLFAREEYDGENVFAYDIWDEGDSYASEISLSSGGNDLFTKIKDYCASNLSEELYFSTLAHKPCAVFLNGEYWGLYYITEKYSAQYINKHFNIAEDNVILIRNWEVEEGTKEDLQKLHEDMEYIGSADLTLPENYTKACELVDIDSVIDYYAFQIYISRRGDWLGKPQEGGNWGVWKADKISDAPYGDGKWRWLLFDANSSSMDDPNHDTFAYVEEKSFYHVFPNLMTNSKFRKKFYERLDYMRTTVFEPEKVCKLIDEMSEETRLQVLLTYDRYYDGIFTEENYEQRVNGMKDNYKQRYVYIGDLIEKSVDW